MKIAALMSTHAVYKTRSALLHGAYSPTEDGTQKTIRFAEDLSRMCLLCSAQLYPMMFQAFDNPDPVKLEEVMKRISSEGMDWLAKAAGYS